MANVCRRCNRPKETSAPGSLTQWISVCDCEARDRLGAGSVLDAQAESINICSSCGKRIVTSQQREGSFTQWIFRFDACSCKRPVPVRVNSERLGSSVSDEAMEAPKLVPIKVDEDLFPQDRYVPLRILGSGGSGTVYLCKDLILEKPVAVKTLNAVDAKKLIAFQKEAKATSKLNHPNIIQTLDFGATDAGKPYMVLELYNGISLADYLRQEGPLTDEVAVHIFEEICFAMHFAHEKGVYHRDLKPSNLILLPHDDATFDVKIIDFGVATLETEGHDVTIQGLTLVGTPAYMSPDQAVGKSYDARSEVYMLGCVMYEAVTGRTPFQAESAMELLTMHVEKRPQVPLAINPEISRTVNDIIMKCMEKEPSLRYGSMRELGELLKSIHKPVVIDSQRLPTIEDGESRPENKSSLVGQQSSLIDQKSSLVGRQSSSVAQKRSQGKQQFSPDENQDRIVVSPVVVLIALLVPLAIYLAYQIVFTSQEVPENGTVATASDIQASDNVAAASGGLMDGTMLGSLDEKNDHLAISNTASGSALNVLYKVRDSDIPEIKRLIRERKVTRVAFERADVTDKVMEALVGEEISCLSVDYDRITPGTFAAISRMKTLGEFRARKTPISTSGLRALSRLPALKKLHLESADLQPDAMQAIGTIVALEQLSLPDNRSMKGNTKGLSELRNLQSLNLKRTDSDDTLALALPKLHKLQTLNLEGNPRVSVKTLRSLQNLPLSALSVASTSVRGPDLVCLHKVPLKGLDLMAINLDDDSLRNVERLPLVRLNLKYNYITDRGLESLAKMRTLRLVGVFGNKGVTASGISRLRRGDEVEVLVSEREVFPLHGF